MLVAVAEKNPISIQINPPPPTHTTPPHHQNIKRPSLEGELGSPSAIYLSLCRSIPMLFVCN